MVTKKIASPAAIALSGSVTAPAVPVRTKVAPAAPPAPAKLPARKRAVAAKPAVKKMPLLQAAASTQPEKTTSAPAPAPAEKMPLPEKAKKVKRVRDSFTMPKAEYAALDELKQRAALLGCPLKKNQLLRAGLKLLAALPDAKFLAALAEVPSPHELPAGA